MSAHLASKPRQARHSRWVFAAALLLGFPVGAQGCAASTDDGSDTGGTPGGGSPSGGKGSGGSKPTGGSASSGGAQASGGGSAAGGALGGGGQGGAGAGEACELPFEAGDCDAAIPVYAHDPQTGRCEPEIYGGCGGNANRFASYIECVQSCGVQQTDMACEVDGITYPSETSRSVPDPFSCNSCGCFDGRVEGCTQGGCTQDCPAGSAPGTTCAVCGPTDACLVLKTGCLPECDPGDAVPCPNGGVCLNGLCGSPCG